MYPAVIAAIWLLVCAWYDWRTREISNWLTLPPFLLAWPAAYILHGIAGLWLTGVTFAVTYILFRAGMMGAADGKVLTALAAVVPESLIPLTLVHGIVAVYLRWRGTPNARVPGMVLYLAGVVLTLVLGWILTNKPLSFTLPR